MSHKNSHDVEKTTERPKVKRPPRTEVTRGLGPGARRGARPSGGKIVNEPVGTAWRP